MTQIFGDFYESLDSQEHLTIVFSPSSLPRKQRWETNGLSADFMADYFAVFFPKSDTKEEVKGVVSFIANELLENALKFNDNTSRSISIMLQMREDKLVFLATNSVNPQAVGKFQAFIQELVTCDPGELYIREVEKNAKDKTRTCSGLGFLTMLNDYMAKLGWKFETIQKDPEVIIVTTMVQLTL